MQLQADVLEIPVVRPAVRETTALGAAQAAGLACGAYASLTELSSLWREDRTFEPEWSPDRRDDEPKEFPVPGETLFQVVRREAGRRLVHRQALSSRADRSYGSTGSPRRRPPRGRGLRPLRGSALRTPFG